MTNIIVKSTIFTYSPQTNDRRLPPFGHSELMQRRVRVDDPRLKDPCGIDNCPSTNYFKVDGRYVCERGHEQVFHFLRRVWLISPAEHCRNWRR